MLAPAWQHLEAWHHLHVWQAGPAEQVLQGMSRLCVYLGDRRHLRTKNIPDSQTQHEIVCLHRRGDTLRRGITLMCGRLDRLSRSCRACQDCVCDGFGQDGTLETWRMIIHVQDRRRFGRLGLCRPSSRHTSSWLVSSLLSACLTIKRTCLDRRGEGS